MKCQAVLFVRPSYPIVWGKEGSELFDPAGDRVVYDNLDYGAYYLLSGTARGYRVALELLCPDDDKDWSVYRLPSGETVPLCNDGLKAVFGEVPAVISIRRSRLPVYEVMNRIRERRFPWS